MKEGQHSPVLAQAASLDGISWQLISLLSSMIALSSVEKMQVRIINKHDHWITMHNNNENNRYKNDKDNHPTIIQGP